MRLIRELSEAGTSTPESRKELQGLIRQWTMVCRGDQQAARLKMQQSEWATARAREAEAAAREAEAAVKAEVAGFEARHKAVEWKIVRERMEAAQRDSMMGMLCSDVGREKAAVLRAKVVDDTLERQQELIDEVDRALGNAPNPAESDLIQVKKKVEGASLPLGVEERSSEGQGCPSHFPQDAATAEVAGESDPIQPEAVLPDEIQSDPGESGPIQP
jgi:hypothetical protein